MCSSLYTDLSPSCLPPSPPPPPPCALTPVYSWVPLLFFALPLVLAVPCSYLFFLLPPVFLLIVCFAFFLYRSLALVGFSLSPSRVSIRCWYPCYRVASLIVFAFVVLCTFGSLFTFWVSFIFLFFFGIHCLFSTSLLSAVITIGSPEAFFSLLLLRFLSFSLFFASLSFAAVALSGRFRFCSRDRFFSPSFYSRIIYLSP